MNENKTAHSALDPEPARTLPPEAYLDRPEAKAALEKSWDGWMRADHYHCKSCNAAMIFWGRISWTSQHGVRAVGACKNCHLVMVEYETTLPKWIDIDKV